MKLLIVDDSSVIRRAIERGIESGEIHEVDQAEDGEQAIQLYAEKQHDIITLDITMPKMDGLTCLDRLMRINPEAKILIISALRDRTTAIRAIKQGASGFLCNQTIQNEARRQFHLLLSD